MKKISLLLLMSIALLPITVTAQRGCCSHHGGVAGCSSSGRQVCADGSLSPSCTCTPSKVYGCTDSNANNYNSSANTNDGSCTYTVYGCINQAAINFNANANTSDGSCQFLKEVEEEIETDYETTYIKKDVNKEKIKTKGEKGLKKVIYTVIKKKMEQKYLKTLKPKK